MRALMRAHSSGTDALRTALPAPGRTLLVGAAPFAYIGCIDTPHPPCEPQRKHPMNTTFYQRVAAFTSAAFFTLVMLVGINGLASSAAQPLQMVAAPAAAAAQAS